MVTLASEVRGVKVGDKFGNRTVIGCPFVAGRFGAKNNKRLWKVVVRCDCGEVAVVQLGNLKSHASDKCRSCHSRKINTKHGGSPSTRPRERLHNIWCSMRERCNCETYARYSQYGGRGIKVCAEWDSYEAFRTWAWGNGYQESLTIDRIDNDKGYSPDNCQWLTLSENSKKQWTDKRKKCVEAN